ncbi:hypothetical protein [Actinophytocola sp.]|uniref:hypothetical protein n=1 Tax=Actinophytocola sp. TaxID=1872138 RepID=UPI002ED438E6
MGSTGDQYVSGGVNWAAYSLEALVNMVADKASVPQLEALADDWRATGDGIFAAADYLAEALDDLMGYWTGASAEQARHAIALNAQWVSDLGTTAHEMGDPIEEAAFALRAAQEGMPELPPAATGVEPGSAPDGAAEVAKVTGGSQLGAAFGGVAAGSESAFESQAGQEELKRVAVETMERFEAAALGIDKSTPQFEGQATELRPRIDIPELPDGGEQWVEKVNGTTGVDARWQALTGMTDTSAAGARLGALNELGSGGFSAAGGAAIGGGGAGGALGGGSVLGPGTIGDVPDRIGAAGGRIGIPGGGGMPGGTPGMTGPIGAPMAGAGAQGAGGGEHRRRVPWEGEDPFDTGETASKPVIGL